MGAKLDSMRHHRRSIRLKDWDYANPSAYFVTICTYQRANIFDEPRFREIAENAWRNIPNQPHAKYVFLHDWILMPNHLHGVIVLGERNGVTNVDLQSERANRGSISSIIGNYKSLVTRRINNIRRTPGGQVWQRGYYERIIRNEREYDAIRAYIRTNPEHWGADPDNLDSIINRQP